MKLLYELWFRYDTGRNKSHKVSEYVWAMTEDQMMELMDCMSDPYEFRLVGESNAT